MSSISITTPFLINCPSSCPGRHLIMVIQLSQPDPSRDRKGAWVRGVRHRSLTDTVGEFDSAVAQRVGVRPSGRFSDPQGLPGSGLKAALRHAGNGWGAGPGIRQQYP